MLKHLRMFALSFPLMAGIFQPQLAQAQANPITNDRPDSFADLTAKLAPAVVNVSASGKLPTQNRAMPRMQVPPGSPFEDMFRDFFDQQGRPQPSERPTSLGSGFIIDAEKGYVVTNNHVIADADDISIILNDDTKIPAKLVGRDEKTDLAVLQVTSKTTKLTSVPWGKSDAMRVGDWVLAIGNPFGLGGTVTQGIISARARNINAGPYDDFIQTDASINRGNSGGPMFNLNGEVIGINTAIFSPSGGSVGIGFAIPSDLARPVINQLIVYGKTKRGWLGVRIQEVDKDIAEGFNLPKAEGALIAEVNEKGPAAKGGLKAGDIILRFDGKDVTAMRNLPRLVADTAVGKTVKVELIRDGKPLTKTITIAELEAAESSGLVASSDDPAKDPADSNNGNSKNLALIGLSVVPLDDTTRAQFNLKAESKGVLVSNVDPNGPAAERQIQPGDLIQEINQQEVTTPDQAAEQLTAAKNAGRKTVLLFIERDGESPRFVPVALTGKTETGKTDDNTKTDPDTKPTP